MAYTTIDNGEEHFNTILYTGDGSADNDITGVGFAPDWVWAKNRGAADAHWILDSTRGATKGLYTNGSAAENTQNHLISFDSDGFSVGNQANGLNTSSNNYVAWNWKANGGTTSSNSNGSITSTVQANTTAGFSIVTYTGDQGTGSTVGHGLGVTPKVVIVKPRDGTTAYGWRIYTEMTGNTNYLHLNSTDGSNAFTDWNNTSPTSSVFTVNSSSPQTVNESGTNYVAYCFAEIQGYSKFGSYTGNGNADGPFIYTGFKPAFVIFKRTDSTASWFLYDNKRDSFNEANASGLYPNLSNVEFSGTSNVWDFTSNGLKGRASTSDTNASGGTYIYIAFSEHPFVSSEGVPVTAR